MRKIADLLTEMGFTPGSNRNVQEAFVRHLIQHAKSVSPQNSEQCSKQPNEKGQQLTFDPTVLGAQHAPRFKRR